MSQHPGTEDTRPDGTDTDGTDAGTSTGTGTEDTDPDATDTEDTDLLPTSFRPPVNRLTAVLGVGILVIIAFTAGAIVQRRFGDTAPVTGAIDRSRASQPGSGGLPGVQGFPGAARASGGTDSAGSADRWGGFATGSASPTASGSSESSRSESGAATGPVAIGKVVSVSGRTLTIENFAGKKVTVTVPEGTPVSSTVAIDLGSLATGQVVSVSGSAGTDGEVTATAVTARGSG